MQRRTFIKKAGLVTALSSMPLRQLLSIEPGLTSKAGLEEFYGQYGLTLHPAMYWQSLENSLIGCQLCPNGCRIAPGQRGRCRCRINADGKLYSLVYGHLSSIAIDPIEKKPVFHMLPGSRSLSISTAGCVLSCKYCQNWQISQAKPEEICRQTLSPAELVAKAIKLNCQSIAYTYNEPTVFYEFMLDSARLAKEKGIRSVMVSCGYINQEPLKELLSVIDVIKVDLKGFSEEFYQKIAGGRLAPVKETIQTLAKAGKLIDIVCLIVPGLNDDADECQKMFDWLLKTVGPNASVFLSRFHPTFKIQNIAPTPAKTLINLRQAAIKTGMHYVYTGNLPGQEGEKTFCHNCKELLIDRLGYQIRKNLIGADGLCPYCKTSIPGIWS